MSNFNKTSEKGEVTKNEQFEQYFAPKIKTP
jgi:hypothetical protein